MIAEAIADLRRRCGLALDPQRRGPVLLREFFNELALAHVALPGLNCGSVLDYLQQEGIRAEPFGAPETRLAGFLFFAGPHGLAFVQADDVLPRRRFSAAHELGHAVLHRGSMGQFIADESISESDDATIEMEREANQFAAELLMPRELCQVRADELQREFKACPRVVLAYRLASELLVSREAMTYRLKHLGIGDDH